MTLPSPRQVVLLGEPSLLREFVPLCTSHGYTVARSLSAQQSASRTHRRILGGCELSLVDLATKKKNIVALDRQLRADAFILSTSTTVSVAEQSSWISHPNRLVGIGAFPTLLQGPVMELAWIDTCAPQIRAAAEKLIASLGKKTVRIHDAVGMVMPRILCTLANEACFALGENIASDNDIDRAMKLGTKHPFGPLERMQMIGAHNVLAVIEALHVATGEERYRAAPLLNQFGKFHSSPSKEPE